MKEKVDNNKTEFKDLQALREQMISDLDEKGIDYKETMSDALFESGLTVYCDPTASFKSIIYNSFNKSKLNPNISLHPEQIHVLNEIEKNEATIVSAPTSFGKTFCVFEYIVRKKPQNVVLIVPTLALAKEYQLKIISNNKKLFEYKIHSYIDEEKEYDFENENNLFILTHERAVSNSVYEKLPQIDFLVIDEVYKLGGSRNDDRTLVLNVAFYYLTKKAKKYVLLAPFVKEISNSLELEKKPKMVRLNYSPVVNIVDRFLVANNRQRFEKCLSLVKEKVKDEKALIYFPNPDAITKYITDTLENEPDVEISLTSVLDFIEWAENEIHPSWSVIKGLKKGYLIHHGAIQTGIRDYLLHIFDTEETFNKLLCTSTLLEGVNTDAKYLIIAKANRQSMIGNSGVFSAFDFYNLVGRTGRLYKYLIGQCFYIKTPNEPSFDTKEDASVSVEFELSEKTEDIDIQINSSKNSPEVKEYFMSIGITPDEYVKKVGAPMRLNTFKNIKKRYDENKEELMKCLRQGKNWKAINLVSSIIQCDNGYTPGVINKVIASANRSVRSVVDELLSDSYIKSHVATESLINQVIKIRSGMLEHKYLNRYKVISMLMELDKEDSACITRADDLILHPIERMFYLNSPSKKMLRSIGVYEKDLDVIISHIGDDFGDLEELKCRLKKEKIKYINSICIVSRFEIEQFTK